MNLQRQTNNSMLELISIFSREMKAPNRNFFKPHLPIYMISLILRLNFFMVKINVHDRSHFLFFYFLMNFSLITWILKYIKNKV